MAYQGTFQRYELKYLLTPAQKQAVLEGIAPYMQPDQYRRTTIRNLYFDTDTFRLARRSLEKPAYKEKLRLRSYAQATEDSPVFVELKKKYDSVVYKRRIALPEQAAMAWLLDGTGRAPDAQIGREIAYFLDYYQHLRPVMFLAYEREALYALDGSDLRITFDENILARQTDLSLRSPVYGASVLAEDRTLMEVKTSGGYPMWMTQLFTEQRIYRTSFSKYGAAYEKMIYPKSHPVTTSATERSLFHAERAIQRAV
ncbi:MAG: polyphosphate polymerase domain-containing protein [Clostridiales bacterium]|nr:polyphosphate polymerase domain-containing protein [Clostridiales bacterium]